MSNVSDQLLEKSPLWKLKDSLSDAQSSTKKMLSKLEKFERRLGNLDSKISRIQTTTENYSRARENITLVLVEVQKTNDYFRVAKEVEPSIKAKFTNPKALFLGIERLSNAKHFFNAHEKGIKASAQAVKTIDALLKKGVASCCEELEKLLSSRKKAVEITDVKSNGGLSVVSDNAIKDIKAICDCLVSGNFTDQYEVYRRVRTKQVLVDLRDHNAATAAAWEVLSQDIPYQRGTHPLKPFAALAHSLLRNELHLWSSVFSSRCTLSTDAYVSVCDAIVKEMKITIFPSIPEGDRNVKSKVHIESSSSDVGRQSNLFLIRLDTFDIFMTRFDDMRDLCDPNQTQGTKASDSIHDIKSRIVRETLQSVQQLLSSTSDYTPTPTVSTQNAGSKVPHEDQSTCDLQPISGSILYCCKELINFTTVYKRLHDLVIEMQLDNPPDANSLTDLIATLLGNVFETLLKKAVRFDPVGKTKQSRSTNLKGHAMFETGEKEGDDYLLWANKHLFLSNNLVSLHIYLQERKTELQAYAGSAGARGPGVGVGLDSLRMLLQLADTVERRLRIEQESFCETVAGGLSFTSPEMREFNEEYKEASKTDKLKLLKSKFSLFNSGIDALLSQQGEWRVSSSVLREMLGSQLLEKIMPPYTDFFQKYSKIPFSKKHMNEYLRFPPVDVERLLRNFFGKS